MARATLSVRFKNGSREHAGIRSTWVAVFQVLYMFSRFIGFELGHVHVVVKFCCILCCCDVTNAFCV